jgi:hypothetical protein
MYRSVYRLAIALGLGAALLLPALAQAQEGGIPAAFVDHWKTSKKYMLALAEQMPAADYAFKPNPDEMSLRPADGAHRRGQLFLLFHSFRPERSDRQAHQFR